MKNYLIIGLFIGALLFLSINFRRSADAASHDEAFTVDKPSSVLATDLKRTVVTATPNLPLDSRKTTLWCGTFQLAWNEACAVVGEDIHLNPEPSVVAELNKKAFTTNDLDAASYVALAGFVNADIHEKIRKSLEEKFGGAAKPQLIPPKSLTSRPQDIVAYAYLFKNLEFIVPFERLENSLSFAGSEVAAFGMARFKSGHVGMVQQVAILDYKGPDDFVIELRTKSAGDRLLLAKIQPKRTLAETIENVETRIGTAHPQSCLPGDELAVPKFNFNLAREYGEIEGAKLVVQNPRIAHDLSVQSAVQDIRLQMDENGVRLKSESHIAFGCAQVPEPAHRLIFDKPFLMILKRRDAEGPYFAMWVGNSELLLPR